MTSKGSPDDFEAAKTIFELLKDLSSERQERVLRWVAEGLGVEVAPEARPEPEAATDEVPADVPASASHVRAPGRHTDIKTFVASKHPNSDQQFAAVVAYYYKFEATPAERRESIDGAALQEAARLSGRRRPANPRVTLNNAKTQGYLDSVGRGEFSLNTVGENLVAMTLPGDSPNSGSSARPRRKKLTKKKSPKRKAAKKSKASKARNKRTSK